MNENERGSLLQRLEKLSSFEEQVSKNEHQEIFQLTLSQLDFFKHISSTVVAIVALIGVGYVYNQDVNKNMLAASLIIALIVLVISISSVRESIDSNEKSIMETSAKNKKWAREARRMIVETIVKDDMGIWEGYVKQSDQKSEDLSENYLGEFIVTLLFLAIGFLVLSFLSAPGSNMIYESASVIIIACLFGFTNWATAFAKVLTKKK